MADETATDRQEWYSPGYGEREHRTMAQRGAEDSAWFFLPYLRSGMRLLDVGSGPGSITLDLAERVAPGEVVGIDVEPQQVDRARTLAAERGVTNVRFDLGDAYAVPFEDGSFDTVYAHTVLLHLRDPLAALKEFRRVLRRSGIVGIRDQTGFRIREPATPLLVEFEVILRRVLEHNRRRSLGVLDFQQRRLLLDAGFARAEAYAEVRSFGTPEAVRQHAAPFASQMDDVFRETVLAEGWADSAKVDAMVAEMRAWGERPDSFGCAIWCAAVGWVDGDESNAGR